MITYFYWVSVILLMLLAFYGIGVKFKQWKPAGIAAFLILVIGSGAYFFHFQQIFVKNWGGVMTVTVPDGHQHMMATWKDDNLWLESYEEKTNTCHFREYSKGAMLEGKVLIKNCNPLMGK
ncbi:MAG: hypothetical protein HWE18_04295 [Gammaproteobacteria bacterium]|nr:hypothetical protein [Gammaproteobacteria bacterium]